MNVFQEEEYLKPFGVSAETGQPLMDLSDAAIAAMVRRGPETDLATLKTRRAKDRSDSAARSFAVIGDVDANELNQSGWGVLFAVDVDQAIKDALRPLIDHRKAASNPFRIFEGPTTLQPGETVRNWLTRQGVRLDVVNPAKGVPFYLLLVGPPNSIPFEFQYLLDIYWAVGRLWFDTVDEFRQYAESVVRYESAAVVPTTRNIALFAPEHDFDTATQLFKRHVANPLCAGDNTTPPIGTRQKFGLKTIFDQHATKAGMAELLRGGTEIGTPSVLFSGSHGMEFSPEDPRQTACQGAIVCQDWEGFGKITEDHWFAANDLPSDAKIHGLIHVFFACHGGGCTEFDNFDRMNNCPRRMAQRPFFSRLPSKFLAHPNGGALAVLAHVERAWAYSFLGDKGGSQCDGFRDVLGRLLRGERIGQATDVFNIRWAALSAELGEMQNNLEHGADIPLKAIGRMWVARDDARNFMIFGDPAIQIRTKDIAVRV